MLSPIWPSTTLLEDDAILLLFGVVTVGPVIFKMVALLLLDVVPLIPFLAFA